MQIDFRQERESREKRVPIIPLLPGWCVLKILDARIAIVGAQEREKLILTLRQESSEIVTAHFMDMTKGHRWEFMNLIEAVLPMMESKSEQGVYEFDPVYLIDKLFECKVRVVTSRSGDKQFNNFEDIRAHREPEQQGSLETEAIPF